MENLHLDTGAPTRDQQSMGLGGSFPTRELAMPKTMKAGRVISGKANTRSRKNGWRLVVPFVHIVVHKTTQS